MSGLTPESNLHSVAFAFLAKSIVSAANVTSRLIKRKDPSLIVLSTYRRLSAEVFSEPIMPSKLKPIHISPERNSCELYLGTSKPESRYGGRWILILEFHECDTYSAFYSIGSPFRDNPYEHELVHDGQCDEYSRDFNEVILMGVVQQERFRTFLEAFYDTQPGPDQYFVLRVVFALWEQGLVESIVVDILLNRPRLEYSAGESEYHYYNLATMDYLFFAEDLKECGFLARRRVGEAKMEDEAGMRWRTRRRRAQEMIPGMRRWPREHGLLGCSSCLDLSDCF